MVRKYVSFSYFKYYMRTLGGHISPILIKTKILCLSTLINNSKRIRMLLIILNIQLFGLQWKSNCVLTSNFVMKTSGIKLASKSHSDKKNSLPKLMNESKRIWNYFTILNT